MNNIKKKIFFVNNEKNFIETNSENIKKIVDILNKDKLVIVKGLKNVGKINFIKEFINKTKLDKNYFYFNKSDDIENNIYTSELLSSLLDDYITDYKKPKIIILQDISKIDGIKDFISEIYKLNYKIILIGNTIKIGGIKEIEILPSININQDNISNSIKYGTIYEVNQINETTLKEKFINLMVSDIFLNDIFRNYGVKSIDLYIFTMTYLAYNNTFSSLRDLHKKLEKIQNISLKTVIDYIDFSSQEKIIKRVYKYDFRTNKPVTSKAKYYFSNNGIRNSLCNYGLNNNILIENLICNILELNNYTIYGGLNGNFEFTFYGEKKEQTNLDHEENMDKIYIHITKETSKDEIKKEIHKFMKFSDESKKYILVKSISDLGIKKTVYDNVEIIEINEFLESFGKI